MKKKFMVTSVARQWNRLVSKFLNLRRRLRVEMKKGDVQSPAYQSLLSKFNALYAKLARMQNGVGIKLASTALLLGVSVTQLQAQSPTFAAGVKLQADNTDIDLSFSRPMFADIDNDGDLDLYVGERYGYIKVFTNDGNGIFSAASDFEADGFPINLVNYAYPCFEDINRDGDLDLYVGTFDGTIKVYTNDGNGIFSVASDLQADGNTIDVGYHSRPVFADIDRDGDMDLYVGEMDGTIKVFTHDGNGIFSASGDLQADGSAINVNGNNNQIFADLDRDGDLDLYVGEKYGNIKVFVNNGSGVFSAAPDLQAGGSNIDVLYHASPVFADIDRDGDLDLYVGDTFGYVTFYENGTPVAPIEYDDAVNLQANGSTIDVDNSSPVFADLDHDGDLDLYVGTVDGTIRVYTNNGSGVFSAASNLKAGGSELDVLYYSRPAFADLDRDGDLDLYVGDLNGFITVCINDGTGTFGAPAHLQANGSDLTVGSRAVPEFADLDRDGDLDLYVGDLYGTINVYTNNGSGVFGASTYLQADGANLDVGDWSHPIFADIDHDDDMDLYVGESYGKIKVYTNNGSGVFSEDNDLLTVGNFCEPVFADIDNDGDMDLYVGEMLGYIKFFEAYKKTTATATGYWNNEATWSAGVPNDNFNAYIGGGEITINAAGNAHHVTIQNNGKLTVASGKTLTAKNVIVKSDASGTGSLVNNGTLSLSGNSTVQRYLPAGGRYYYISSSVSNATAEVFDDGNGLTNSNNQLYKYENNAWVKMETASESLVAMLGYAFKSNAARTINFMGTLNDGVQSISLSGPTGFSLFGNPYPSAIDWGLNNDVPASWSGDVSTTIWYRVGGMGSESGGGGNFATYNRNGGGSTNSGQRYIPAMQSFWVQNTGIANFSVGNDARVHDGTAFYKNAQKPTSKGIYLRINGGDEALIAFNPAANDAYNSTKMFADGLAQIYTLLNGKQMAINTFTGIANNLSLPVAIKVATAGSQSIAMKDFNDFDASVSVYLEDKSTGAMHDLRSGEYSFDATEGTINDRFVLHFTNGTTGVTNANTSDVNVYAYDKMVYVSLSGKQTTSSEVSVFDVAGRLVAAKTLSGFQNLTGLHIAQTGVYVVKVSTANGITTHKIVIK